MEKEEIKNDPFFNLLEIIRVRKVPVIIGFLSVFAMTIVGILLMPALYETTAKVIVNIPMVSKDLPYLEDFRDSRAFVSNQPVVASSRVIYEKVAKDLNLAKKDEQYSFFRKLRNAVFKKDSHPLEEAIDDLYKDTDVNMIRGTNIIKIDARSTSSQLAATIANTLAKTYTDYVNDLIRNRTKTAHDVIAQEFQGVRDDITKSQEALKKLRGSDNVIADRIAILRELGEYRVQYEQIQSKIHRIQHEESQEKINKLENQKKRRSGEIHIGKVSDSQRAKEIKATLQKLQNELNMELTHYTEKHPNVKKLRSQIASLEKELLQEEQNFALGPGIKPIPEKSEVEENRETLDASVTRVKLGDQDIIYLEGLKDNLSKQIQTLEGRLYRLSLNEADAGKLSRDIGNREVDYAILKEKLETVRILKVQSQEGTVKILENAAPPPFSSNKKKIVLLLVGFVASIVFSLGTGFIAEYRDNTLKAHEDVENFLKLPVLAIIPTIPQLMEKGKSWFKFGRKT